MERLGEQEAYLFVEHLLFALCLLRDHEQTCYIHLAPVVMDVAVKVVDMSQAEAVVHNHGMLAAGGEVVESKKDALAEIEWDILVVSEEDMLVVAEQSVLVMNETFVDEEGILVANEEGILVVSKEGILVVSEKGTLTVGDEKDIPVACEMAVLVVDDDDSLLFVHC